MSDLIAYSNSGSVPFGLVAFYYDDPCGVTVLKSDAISGYTHLSPWVGAGFVVPQYRNRGIGAKLLKSLELETKKLGYSHVYCGTAHASNLLGRSGWRKVSEVCHNGEEVKVYEKAL